MADKKLNVLDTFSGAGGFSLGFEKAGFTTYGAVELDSWACETLSYNNPKTKILQKSISDINDRELSRYFKNKIDVLLGGPPCQGYSICNKNNSDPKDPRNSLFTEFLRVSKVLKPKVVIMENVPNIIKAKTRDKINVIEIVVNELKKLGYYVHYKILNASNFGVPQMRQRLFVMGLHCQTNIPFPIETHSSLSQADLFSGKMKKTPTLWEAISDLPEIQAREGSEISEYTKKPETAYQKLMRGSSSKLYNHKAMNHSKRLVERFASMKCGENTTHVPSNLRPIKRNTKEYSESAYSQNNRRMYPNSLCHTIPASFYANFVHPFSNRNFTAREGARIQSFPDHYVFKGKPTVVSQKLLEREGRIGEKHLCQYNQIGNAVPPLLAQAIAENIKEQKIL